MESSRGREKTYVSLRACVCVCVCVCVCLPLMSWFLKDKQPTNHAWCVSVCLRGRAREREPFSTYVKGSLFIFYSLSLFLSLSLFTHTQTRTLINKQSSKHMKSKKVVYLLYFIRLCTHQLAVPFLRAEICRVYPEDLCICMKTILSYSGWSLLVSFKEIVMMVP